MFSMDVFKTVDGRKIVQITRIDMSLTDDRITVQVRAFVPAGQADATVMLNGVWSKQAGQMRGTVNLAGDGMLDGIILSLLTDDVAVAINDGIKHMARIWQAKQPVKTKPATPAK